MNLKTAVVVGAFLLATSVAGPVLSQPIENRPVRDHPPTASKCEAEAVAFIEVADLAHAFESAGAVFDTALFELREQLLDCLIIAEEEGEKSSPSFDGDLGVPSQMDEQRRI